MRTRRKLLCTHYLLSISSLKEHMQREEVLHPHKNQIRIFLALGPQSSSWNAWEERTMVKARIACRPQNKRYGKNPGPLIE
jgi:hypothetical protein